MPAQHCAARHAPAADLAARVQGRAARPAPRAPAPRPAPAHRLLAATARPRARAVAAVAAAGAAAPGAGAAAVEEDAMERMEKSLDSVRRAFATVRTGRASPAMLDRVDVDYYGAMTPLKQIAGISTPDASQIVVQPYDTAALPAIERAIMASDLGVTPSNDGRLIRLNVPPLTAERRKEMAKSVAKLAEEGKVAVRNVRRDAMKAVEKLEKDKALGEDGKKALEAAVQELTDDYVKQIEALAKAKDAELKKV